MIFFREAKSTRLLPARSVATVQISRTTETRHGCFENIIILLIVPALKHGHSFLYITIILLFVEKLTVERNITSSSFLISTNLNQPRPINCRTRHCRRVVKRPQPHHHSRNRQPIREPTLKREARGKSRQPIVALNIYNRLHNCHILAGDIRDVHSLQARFPSHLKPERLVHGLGIRSCDSQWLQCRDVDRVDVWARAWDDEALQRGEGERASGGGQEGRAGGPLGLHDAVPAFLLAFLADDRGDEGHECGVVVCCEGVRGALQGAEDYVGEGRGEGDGFVEGCYTGECQDMLLFADGYAYGKVYLHGSMGPALKAFRAPFAFSA
jgi:hypothetical protein